MNTILGVIRRAALLRTRLLPRYPGGDYVLLGELCLLGSFVEVPHVLFLRRIHSAASSQMVGDERRLVPLLGVLALQTFRRRESRLHEATRALRRLLPIR